MKCDVAVLEVGRHHAFEVLCYYSMLRMTSPQTFAVKE